MKRSLKLSAFLAEGYRVGLETNPLLHDAPATGATVFYTGRWWKVTSTVAQLSRDLIGLED